MRTRRPEPHLISSETPSVPAGWQTEPVGDVDGQRSNVAYDPDRHSVIWYLNPPAPSTAEELHRNGWQRAATHGRGELWVLDRIEATRRALQRPAGGIEPPAIA